MARINWRFMAGILFVCDYSWQASGVFTFCLHHYAAGTDGFLSTTCSSLLPAPIHDLFIFHPPP
jgi:thiamine transporter ThiT